MSGDRIGYNTPDDFNGLLEQADSVDEIVLSGCSVHIEMLDDDKAMLHLQRGGQWVRGHLTAVPLSRAQRRDLAEARGEPLRDVSRAALLITVEDDELGIGEAS